ncbi:Folylpolyglutamate synthetase [Salix suchowensis]|nr:Folylpolyglutamate synthetase [Salix suchowensis]
MSSQRTYQSAIEHLNSLQSNAATLEAVRASGSRMPEHAFRDAGVSQKNWICSLFTSPHLVAVRERIRINGQPISEEAFAKYFFDVWDKLEANDVVSPVRNSPREVDATVLEVGVGGKYDCTNLVPKPVVAGVTSLGIDHVFVLGKTLSEIAWQKGGIFKEGAPAFTVNQPEEGLTMLRHVQKNSRSPPTRILVFNCTSGRSGDTFLGGILAKAAAQLKLHDQNDSDATHLFDHVIFCTNVTYADGGFKGAEDPKNARGSLDLARPRVPEIQHSRPSFIEHAVNIIRQVDRESDTKQTQVLVAGSLHLVGGVIEVAGLSEVAL